MHIRRQHLTTAVAGLLALGGSALGVSLSATTASAAAKTSVASHAVHVTPLDEATGSEDPGANVQVGDQNAPDATASTSDEGATESQGTSDGSGGHEDAAGINVDYQSTADE